VEGRRSAEENPRHGPMLDAEPGYIGALQCHREDVQVNNLGVLFSKVGTVCDRIASTDLCGGRPATGVPTATKHR
jgi:hypothetical protein